LPFEIAKVLKGAQWRDLEQLTDQAGHLAAGKRMSLEREIGDKRRGVAYAGRRN
jgi:hypothetical protein